MNSVKDVHDHLLKYNGNEQVDISLQEEGDIIVITLSPEKKVLAGDDMVEIICKRKVLWFEYWTSTTHWHPKTFEDLYEGLLRYLT